MKRKCAFLTLEDPSGFRIYDHLLIGPLGKLGWSVQEIPWSRQDVDWSDFNAVIIRSTWDYQNSPDEFLATLDTIEQTTPLFNPAEICRWNLNKRYLDELSHQGVPIVPTLWLDALEKPSIETAFESFDADRMVAKPLIGANADCTFVLDSRDSTSWLDPLRAFRSRDVMLQPFVSSIQTEGEFSLFFFGGRLSHAIVKRPANGDFRVQEEHGGIIHPTSPSKSIVGVATDAVCAVETPLLYARIDVVLLELGSPAVIEMELIEPSLYFNHCPDSAGMFANTFRDMISKQA